VSLSRTHGNWICKSLDSNQSDHKSCNFIPYRYTGYSRKQVVSGVALYDTREEIRRVAFCLGGSHSCTHQDCRLSTVDSGSDPAISQHGDHFPVILYGCTHLFITTAPADAPPSPPCFYFRTHTATRCLPTTTKSCRPGNCVEILRCARVSDDFATYFRC
jgi:hypothetical protein